MWRQGHHYEFLLLGLVGRRMVRVMEEREKKERVEGNKRFRERRKQEREERREEERKKTQYP